MPSTATVTSDTGPAIQSTSVVYGNVTSVEFLIDKSIIRIVSNCRIIDFDYASIGTVTYTIDGANATVTIS